MKKNQPKIESITIYHTVDTDADTSMLGKFTDEVSADLICCATGEYYKDMDSGPIPSKGHQYRSFKPCAGDEKPGTKDYYKYGLQDWNRMDKLMKGDYCYLGITAKASVSYKIGGGNYRLESLSSGGLWGIESDSGDYLKEVEEEQLADLLEHLKAFSVNCSNFKTLAKNAEVKDN